MQKVSEEVYHEGEEPMIHDGFRFDDSFYWEEPGPSLRDMGLIKQLRTFENSLQEKLAELEKDPVPNRELIMQERGILEATQKELRRLERQSFNSQLGID